MIGLPQQPINGKQEYDSARYARDVAEELITEGRDRKRTTGALAFVLLDKVDLKFRTVQSEDHLYEVDPERGCPCPDTQFRNKICKHYIALEIARRVAELMGKEQVMTVKKKDLQEESETTVQNGETEKLGGRFKAGTLGVFTSNQPKSDDIPESEFPGSIELESDDILKPMKVVNYKTPFNNPADRATTGRIPAEPSVVHTEGNQHVDHPSTLCIKRQVGSTELMWTFCGTTDEEVWTRAAAMIQKVDRLAKQYEPMNISPAATPAQATTSSDVSPSPPNQAIPSQRTPPECPVHGVEMEETKYGGYFCTRENTDGSHCDVITKG